MKTSLMSLLHLLQCYYKIQGVDIGVFLTFFFSNDSQLLKFPPQQFKKSLSGLVLVWNQTLICIKVYLNNFDKIYQHFLQFPSLLA